MAELEKIEAAIDGDSSGFEAAMHRASEASQEAVEEIGNHFQELGEKVKKLGEFFDVTLTLPLEELARHGEEHFEEAAKAAALLDVAIKATGDSVGYTTDQLKEMAEALHTTSAYDIHDILGNLINNLLKFHDIHGEVFKRASQDIIDYASFTGSSLESSTRIIGRALENPLQALTLLKRQGVNFTDTQKEMIKKFVEMGDKAGAMNIILNGMEGTFKGAAAAMRNLPAGKIKADMQEVGEGLKVVGGMVDRSLVPMTHVLAEISRIFQRLNPDVQKTVVMFLTFVAAIGPILTGLGFMITLWPKLVAGFELLTTAVTFLGGAMNTLILDVLPIVAAFALLAVAGQAVYDNWSAVKAEASGTWGWVKVIVENSIAGILTSLSKIPGMGKMFQDTIKHMRDDSAENMKDIHNDFSTLVNAPADLGQSMKNIGTEIGGVTDKIKNAFMTMAKETRKSLKDIKDDSKDAFVEKIPKWVVDFNAKLHDTAQESFPALASAITTFTTTTMHNLMTFTGDWKQLMVSTLSTILDAVIQSGIQQMLVILNIAHAWAALWANPLLAIGAIAVLIGVTAALSAPPKMANGGLIDSPTTVIAGEAGPEVIMPVVRGPNGKMGVQVSGAGASGSSASSALNASGSSMGSRSSDGTSIHVMLDGKTLFSAIGKASKDGRIVIHPNAVRP